MAFPGLLAGGQPGLTPWDQLLAGLGAQLQTALLPPQAPLGPMPLVPPLPMPPGSMLTAGSAPAPWKPPAAQPPPPKRPRGGRPAGGAAAPAPGLRDAPPRPADAAPEPERLNPHNPVRNRLRKLRKLLRQIEEIRQRVQQGMAIDPGQEAKAGKRGQLEAELEVVEREYDTWEQEHAEAAAGTGTTTWCARARGGAAPAAEPAAPAAPRFAPYPSPQKPAAAGGSAAPPDEEPMLGPKGGQLQWTSGLPEGYHSVLCDECGATGLHQLPAGFGHEEGGEYDVCNDCIAMAFPTAKWPPY